MIFGCPLDSVNRVRSGPLSPHELIEAIENVRDAIQIGVDQKHRDRVRGADALASDLNRIRDEVRRLLREEVLV